MHLIEKIQNALLQLLLCFVAPPKFIRHVELSELGHCGDDPVLRTSLLAQRIHHFPFALVFPYIRERRKGESATKKVLNPEKYIHIQSTLTSDLFSNNPQMTIKFPDFSTLSMPQKLS